MDQRSRGDGSGGWGGVAIGGRRRRDISLSEMRRREPNVATHGGTAARVVRSEITTEGLGEGAEHTPSNRHDI